MNRVLRAALTALLLAVLVPVLVLASAAAGLAPRHWSGIALSGWELPWLAVKPQQGALVERPTQLDAVTDELIAMGDGGWFAVVPLSDGSVYVETRSLEFSALSRLGRRFGGDQVSMVYSPLQPDAYPMDDDGGSRRTLWQRTDPLTTWVTLMFGFPWQLGVGLLLTAAAYLLLARRRAARATYAATVS